MLNLDDNEVFDITEESEPKKILSERIAATAKKHAADLHTRGVTVDQVVHDYEGPLPSDYRTCLRKKRTDIGQRIPYLNRLLDNAIAAAVTEYDLRPESLG